MKRIYSLSIAFLLVVVMVGCKAENKNQAIEQSTEGTQNEAGQKVDNEEKDEEISQKDTADSKEQGNNEKEEVGNTQENEDIDSEKEDNNQVGVQDESFPKKLENNFFDDGAYDDWLVYNGSFLDEDGYDGGSGLVGIDTRSQKSYLLIPNLQSSHEVVTSNGIYFMTFKGIYQIKDDEYTLIKPHKGGGVHLNTGYILYSKEGQTYYDIASGKEYLIESDYPSISEEKITSAYMYDDQLFYTTNKAVKVLDLLTMEDKLVQEGKYSIIRVEDDKLYLIQDKEIIVNNIKDNTLNTYNIKGGPFYNYQVRDGNLYGMVYRNEESKGELIKIDLKGNNQVTRTTVLSIERGFYTDDFIYVLTPSIHTFEYNHLNEVSINQAIRVDNSDLYYWNNSFRTNYGILDYQQVDNGYVNHVVENRWKWDQLDIAANREKEGFCFLNHQRRLMEAKQQQAILDLIGAPVYDYDYDDTTIIYTDKEEKSLYVMDRNTGDKQKLVDGKVYNLKIRDGNIYYCSEKNDYTVFRYGDSESIKVYNDVVNQYEVLDNSIFLTDKESSQLSVINGDQTIIIESKNEVSDFTRMGSKIYYIALIKGINKSGFSFDISALYSVDAQYNKEFIGIIPIGTTDNYFTYDEHLFFQNKYNRTILQMDSMSEKLWTSEDIIFENEKTILFEMVIPGSEYWSETIIVVYNKEIKDIQTIIRDTEPSVWNKDYFTVKLIGEWIYFNDQEYNDNHRLVRRVSRFNINTYEMEKVAPINGNDLEYGVDGDYMVIHDRYSKDFEDNNIMTIHNMSSGKGQKVGQVSDATRDTSFRSFQGVIGEHFYYINAKKQLVQVELVDTNSKSILIEDFKGQVLEDISSTSENRLYYIDKDGYIKRLNLLDGAVENVSSKKVSRSIFFRDNFQGYLVSLGEPESDYKKITSYMYQDNKIYYVSDEGILMSIDIEDLSNRLLMDNCQYVIGNAGVEDNRMFFVDKKGDFYQLDIRDTETISTLRGNVFSNEIYYHRNSLIYITKDQKSVMHYDIETGKNVEVGAGENIKSFKYIHNNVVLFESENDHQTVMLDHNK